MKKCTNCFKEYPNENKGCATCTWQGDSIPTTEGRLNKGDPWPFHIKR